MTLTAADIPFASITRTPDEWRLIDDVELMELPDPDFLVDGILQRRGIGVIYGPSGAAKTTLVASLQVAVATGRDWFGRTVRHRGTSAYIATEDVSGFKVRLRAAKVAAGLSLAHSIGVYTFPEPIDLRDDVSIARFIRFVRDSDVCLELATIDTYAGATPGAAENSSEDTTAAMAAAQKIRDSLKCAVILVHHTNAGGTRERGHSSMRGAADVMISMTPVDDVVHVECSKQRNAAPFSQFALKLTLMPEIGGCVLRLAADVLKSSDLTATQLKVLAVLRDTFMANGATKAEWRSSCPDVAERSFHRAAAVLENELGLVRRAGPRFFAQEAR